MSKIKLGLMLFGIITLVMMYPSNLMYLKTSNGEFWMGLGVVALVGIVLSIFIFRNSLEKK